MNFLTHLYFSGDSIDNTKGLIIGNAAKVNHLSNYNLEVLKGIAMDMQIRNFAKNHPAFNNSKQRINSRYISHAPFLVNIFYDHLLAKNWNKYSDVSLEKFSWKIYAVMYYHMNAFPFQIRKFAPEMINKRWITGLTNIEGTHQYLHSISKNKNLDQGLFELTEHYHQFNNDFEEYFVDLCRFMEKEVSRFNAIKNEKEILLLSA